MLHITTNYTLHTLCCSPHKICNEEGKFNGMDPNRAVYGENHEIMDVIFGPFFICDCSGQNFGSLDREQLERFRKQFRNPERLISVNGKILSVPYNPQQEQSREGR